MTPQPGIQQLDGHRALPAACPVSHQHQVAETADPVGETTSPAGMPILCGNENHADPDRVAAIRRISRDGRGRRSSRSATDVSERE
jgi:hypothetical protein